MPTIPKHRPAYLPDIANIRNPSGDQAFYQSAAWRAARKWHLRAHPICSVCGIDCTKARAGAIDHIVALPIGAKLHEYNLWTLCKVCHDTKSRLEQHGLKVIGYGDEGEQIPAPGERERIKQLIKDRI
jgi:5-methylcytosine-specific restriction endonuclease McrA